MKKPLVRWVLGTTALLAVAITLVFFKKNQFEHERLRSISGESGTELRNLKRSMDEVQPYDKQNFKRLKDLTQAEASKQSTGGLICAAVASPAFETLMVLYDKPELGVYRAIRSSATVAELEKREDLGKGFEEAAVILAPRLGVSPLDSARNSLQLMAYDSLLTYPPFLEKVNGHERALLAALCARYQAMNAINRSQLGGQAPYGASLRSTLQTSLVLAHRISPSAEAKCKTMKDPEAIMSALTKLSAANGP